MLLNIFVAVDPFSVPKIAAARFVFLVRPRDACQTAVVVRLSWIMAQMGGYKVADFLDWLLVYGTLNKHSSTLKMLTDPRSRTPAVKEACNCHKNTQYSAGADEKQSQGNYRYSRSRYRRNLLYLFYEWYGLCLEKHHPSSSPQFSKWAKSPPWGQFWGAWGR